MQNLVQDELTVVLVQPDIKWQSPAQNCEMYVRMLDEHSAKADVIVLPEMFATGFSMDSRKAAQNMDGESIVWMKQQAAQRNAAVCGSLAIIEDGEYYNRMLWVEPDGSVQFYDKRHLFRMAGEHERYQSGEGRVVVNFRGWDILLQVCYDLRFPVYSRNRNDYDLALYVANWPAVRRYPWRTLLAARAIENLCYVVGVNRVGVDANQLEYSGDSMLLDFKGEIMCDEVQGKSFCASKTLLKTDLLAFREQFPAYQDADDFTLTL
ncbi:amidohydrolase [Aliamphritea ceti]|uniref:amidohydrolase n=1 Tax=Aliamphritea ceti TaxID=1524258 RepID=UPI0021C2E70E|nr:amidohydrolase [Aliamphritea ceti]